MRSTHNTMSLFICCNLSNCSIGWFKREWICLFGLSWRFFSQFLSCTSSLINFIWLSLLLR
jgi:hypothetical protein